MSDEEPEAIRVICFECGFDFEVFPRPGQAENRLKLLAEAGCPVCSAGHAILVHDSEHEWMDEGEVGLETAKAENGDETDEG